MVRSFPTLFLKKKKKKKKGKIKRKEEGWTGGHKKTKSCKL